MKIPTFHKSAPLLGGVPPCHDLHPSHHASAARDATDTFEPCGQMTDRAVRRSDPASRPVITDMY